MSDTTLAHRLSSYAVLATSVSENLQLSTTVYLQPRLDRLRDVRVLNESSLLSRATKHLSLKLAMTSAFDAEPPAGVRPLDSALKASLLATF